MATSRTNPVMQKPIVTFRKTSHCAIWVTGFHIFIVMSMQQSKVARRKERAQQMIKIIIPQSVGFWVDRKEPPVEEDEARFVHPKAMGRIMLIDHSSFYMFIST